MALAADTVWEVRTDGNDTNGGGFTTSATGTDYSQQASKRTAGDVTNISTTDTTCNGTTTITSASANFTSDIVGNVVYIAGGTGTLTGAWFRVVTFTNSTTVVLDRTPGTSNNATLNIGGALLTINQAGTNLAISHVAYVLNNGSGIYQITANIPNINAILCGYTSNRTLFNSDNRPTIQYNASTLSLSAGTATAFFNFIVDGNSQTTAKPNNGGSHFRIHWINMNTTATAGSNYYCTATNNSAVPMAGISFFCESYANSSHGFTGSAIHCLSRNNTGASSNGFNGGTLLANCIAYGNGGNGFVPTNMTRFFNCIAESNTGAGFAMGTTNGISVTNCAYYNNTGGGITGGTGVFQFLSGNIAITAGSVFTNAASGDFSLNNTTNQGALLRAAGYPTTFPVSTTGVNYLDIGALQHQDPAGGGGMIMERVRVGY